MDLRNSYDKVQQNFKTDNIGAGKKIKFKSDESWLMQMAGPFQRVNKSGRLGLCNDI